MGLLDRLRGGGDRVCVLGIDGVPESLIADNPDVFEHLHAIREAGTGGAIDSIVPPESSACWPALTTGVNPGKTGVYGFQDRETTSYETYIPLGSHVKATRLWDRVTAAGRDASVINVPVTFPPDESVQRMVSGFLSPNLSDATHPATETTHLERDGYIVDVDASLGHEADKSAFMENAHRTLEGRFNTLNRLIETDDWDLLFGVFMTTDRVNHFLFDQYEEEGADAEAFISFYRTLDRYIGELHRALADDVDLLVVSDHGFTTLEYEVDLNAFLAEEGWLSFATDKPEDLTDIDPASQAYSLIPGRVYLNLEGREPSGAVARSDYDDRKDTLRDALSALEGPDGRPVCKRIVDGEEAFHGPHTTIAPDLVAIPNDGYDLKAGFDSNGDIFDTGPRTGMHTFDNATLSADVDLDITDADLLDVAPTVLDLLDVTIDTGEIDGRSLFG